MTRAFCLLHANCQGEALRLLLEASPAFARRFHVLHILNYTRERLPEALLDSCALYLHQELGAKWGELSSAEIRRRLPPSCQSLRLPNLFFQGYWPTWTRLPGVDFADSLLETLLQRGLSPLDASFFYERARPAVFGPAADIAEASLRREEEKERDAPIRCAPLLRQYWRTEQLFLTVNHPGRRLVLFVADSVLRLLGLGGLPESTARDFVLPQEDFWLPLPPALGLPEADGGLNLPFASRGRRYRIFARQMTAGDYARCYLSCRAAGEGHLLSFLSHLPPDRPA